MQSEAKTHWQHFVAVILLNHALANKSTRIVYREILTRWPTPQALYEADYKELVNIIRPCKLEDVKAEQLQQMSGVFRWWNGNPMSLPGVDKYGSDSFRLIMLKETNIKPDNSTLKTYAHAAKRNVGAECKK